MGEEGLDKTTPTRRQTFPSFSFFYLIESRNCRVQRQISKGGEMKGGGVGEGGQDEKREITEKVLTRKLDRSFH